MNNRKIKLQNAVESENVNNKSKRFKSDISLMEATITATAIAKDIKQDEDCIIVGYTSKRDITADDKARHKILDDTIAPLS